MSFRRIFHRPNFYPMLESRPRTHKIDASGRIVPLDVPIPLMPGQAPRPVLSASEPPPGASCDPAQPAPPHLATEQQSPEQAIASQLIQILHDHDPQPPVAVLDSRAVESPTSEAIESANGAPNETQTPQPPPKSRTRSHRARRRRAKPAAAATQTPSVTPPEPATPDTRSPHERSCTICRHRYRDAIEEEFLHWHNPRHIADDYRVGWRSLYRHAHALNLFARRDRNLRFALAAIVQRAHQVDPSADAVIRAVRAYARVNSAGEWVEPPTHVIVSSGGRFVSANAAHQALPSAEPAVTALPSAPVEHLPVTECRAENDANP